MALKKSALFLAAVMIASTLAGCGGQQQDNVSSVPTVSAESSVSVSADEGSAAGESSSETGESVSQGSEVSKDTSNNNSKTESSSNSSDESSKSSSVKKDESSAAETSSKQESSKASQNSQASQTSSKPSETTSHTEEKPGSSQQNDPSGVTEPSKPQQSPSKPEVSPKPQEDSKPAQESSGTTAKITKSDAAIGDINTYNDLFNFNNKVTLQITMQQSEMKKLQADYEKYSSRGDSKSEIYRKADVTISVAGKTYTIEEVGIRLKGNVSLEPVYAEDGTLNITHYKLSFDETFDDKTEYGSEAKVWKNENERKLRKKRTFATMNGLEVKWNFNYDETNIREIYAAKLFESSDVLVQKINLSQLKFNGNNYGVVKIYEPVDKTFLEKRLPKEAIGGDLYKCAWGKLNNGTGNYSGATYKTSTISSIGETEKSIGKKFVYSIKTNKSSTDHSSLKNFIKAVNKSNPSKESIEAVLDTDYFARFMAAYYFAGDPDDIRNNYNNHFIYFRKDNGKAIFIPYDNDRTLGVTYGYNPDGKGCSDRNPYSGWAAGANGGQENPLINLTIIDNNNKTFNYVKDIYTKQLKALAASDLMKSDADFVMNYNKAKKNYESVITPSVKFANTKEKPKFSLDGRLDSNKEARANMSFEQFRSAIISKFKSKVK